MIGVDSAVKAARFLLFVSCSVLFGLSLFRTYAFAPDAPHVTRDRGLQAVLVIALILAGLAMALWAMAQTAAMSGEATDAGDPGAIWSVLSTTHIGRVALVRAGSLLAWAATLATRHAKLRRVLQVAIGAAILASFAWSGHGNMNAGWPGVLHLAADVLHLLAAGLWVGALVAFCTLILRSLSADGSSELQRLCEALERFSGIGSTTVGMLVLTGLINSWFVVGPAHWRALFHTGYGIGLLIKLGMFAAMLLLAASNRFWLTPRLRAEVEHSRRSARALRSLRASLVLETSLAVLVLLAVSIFGTLQPPVVLGWGTMPVIPETSMRAG